MSDTVKLIINIHKLKDYVWQTYGFNVGGALGKFKGEYADEEA